MPHDAFRSSPESLFSSSIGKLFKLRHRAIQFIDQRGRIDRAIGGGQRTVIPKRAGFATFEAIPDDVALGSVVAQDERALCSLSDDEINKTDGEADERCAI